MARSKSAVVSGMGLALAIMEALRQRVGKFGGDDGHLHRLVTPEGDLILDQVARTIIGTPSTVCASTAAVELTYSVTVDRSKSLASQIAAGRYDFVSDDIKVENFPVSGASVAPVDIVLFHFNRVIGSDEAEAEMFKAGYQPADLPELLALGADQPELQRQFPIIALRSVWQRLGGLSYVPVLYGWHGGSRGLDLDGRDRGWAECCRFVAVRK